MASYALFAGLTLGEKTSIEARRIAFVIGLPY